MNYNYIMNSLWITRYQNLNFQNLPRELLSQLNCVYNNESKLWYFPLVAFGTRIVGYKSIGINRESSETVPASNTSGLIIYKQKSTKSDDTAVLVPTIHDLLALVAKKAAPVVICLPYGLQNLPQQVLPSLEKYKKLILWFGNDAASWDVSRNFAKKLNEKRCFFVRPIDVQPRPEKAARLDYDLKEIIQKAQPIWHKSITTFNSIRQDVLSDLQNIEKVQGIKWKRYPTLSKILKGHRRGEFTILTGPTGQWSKDYFFQSFLS